MKAVTKIAVAAGVLALGLSTGAATYSLWSDPATTPGGTITAGNLQLVPDGETIWTETSPDVPKTTHAGKTIDPAVFLATPGDTFNIKQSFTATLEGENMLGKVAVRWDNAAGAELPAGVSATYIAENRRRLDLRGSPGHRRIDPRSSGRHRHRERGSESGV